MAVKRKKLTDDDLVAIIDDNINQSQNYSSKLSSSRAEALKLYNCDPLGNEKRGRSTYVSSDVRDVIGWALPNLIKILTADDVIVFDETSEETKGDAEDASLYAHHILHKKNNGFMILYNLCHDALLNKNGYVMTAVDASPIYKKENYEGLTKYELAQLLDDPSVDIVSQKINKADAEKEVNEEYCQHLDGMIEQIKDGTLDPRTLPPEVMLALQGKIQSNEETYDVTIKRKKGGNGRIIVENVPPEEMIIPRSCRGLDLDKSPFVARQVKKTISWLRSQGYDVEDDINDSIGNTSDFSSEHVARDYADGSYFPSEDTGKNDPSQREVTLIDAYFLVDYDGSGISQLRCVKKVGNKILENVEVICQPFTSTSPYPIPHKHNGNSMTDLVKDLQRVKSMLTRASLDSFAFNISPPKAINVEAIVDVNDLLDTAPGSFIRCRGDVNAAVSVMPSSGIGTETLPFFEYIDNVVESRTGTSKMSQGINANAFTQTAFGTAAVMSAAQEKMMLVTAIIANTGLGDIYKKIIKLAAEYLKEPENIKLRQEFKQIDPSKWSELETITLQGLDKQSESANIQSILNLQQTVGAIPDPAINSMIDPEKVHNALSKAVRALGSNNPAAYFNDPNSQEYQAILQQRTQPQPLQPDPNMLLAQAQMALSQVKEHETQIKAQQAGNDAQKAQAELSIKQGELSLKQQEFELKKAVETAKAELDRTKVHLENEIEVAKINQQAFNDIFGDIKSDLEQTDSNPDNMDGEAPMKPTKFNGQEGMLKKILEPHEQAATATHSRLDALAAQLEQLHNHMARPKQVIRDENGKISGIQTL